MHCCCMRLNGSAQLTTTAMHKYQVTERNEIHANTFSNSSGRLMFLKKIFFFFSFVIQIQTLSSN